MMDPKDVGEWQHEEFYRYVAQAHDRPRYTLHYRTDAPLNIRSIFYVPEMVRPASSGQRCECLSAAPWGGGTAQGDRISQQRWHFP